MFQEFELAKFSEQNRTSYILMYLNAHLPSTACHEAKWFLGNVIKLIEPGVYGFRTLCLSITLKQFTS